MTPDALDELLGLAQNALSLHQSLTRQSETGEFADHDYDRVGRIVNTARASLTEAFAVIAAYERGEFPPPEVTP